MKCIFLVMITVLLLPLMHYYILVWKANFWTDIMF